MSNRRRRARDRAARGGSEQLRLWWDATGLMLGCSDCRRAPRCDEGCGRPAVTVAAFGGWQQGQHPIALRGQEHAHLCAPCRDAVQAATGLPRIEVG